MFDSTKIRVICKKYAVNTLYLFGSFADGSDNEDSDIDLGYLSVSYESNPDYGSFYFDLQGVFERPIDLLDLRKAPLGLAFRVIKAGKVLCDFDEEVRTDFEDGLIQKYLDFSTFSRLMQVEIGANFGVEVKP